MSSSTKYTRLETDARGVEAWLLLTKPLPPAGAWTGGYGLSGREADALIKKWRSLLSIVGLTVREVARMMVEYDGQVQRRASARSRRHG